MKRLSILTALIALLIFSGRNLLAVPANPQDDSKQQTTGEKAKQDTKNAGRDAKDFGKNVGGAAKNGTKKGVHEGAKGASKVENKTDDNSR